MTEAGPRALPSGPTGRAEDWSGVLHQAAEALSALYATVGDGIAGVGWVRQLDGCRHRSADEAAVLGILGPLATAGRDLDADEDIVVVGGLRVRRETVAAGDQS